jgi:hypothetical protein
MHKVQSDVQSFFTLNRQQQSSKIKDDDVKKEISMKNSSSSRNWVHVARLNDLPDSPIRTSTAYAWNHRKRFPQLFKHVGGKLFLDLGGLYEMAEAGKLR